MISIVVWKTRTQHRAWFSSSLGRNLQCDAGMSGPIIGHRFGCLLRYLYSDCVSCERTDRPVLFASLRPDHRHAQLLISHLILSHPSPCCPRSWFKKSRCCPRKPIDANVWIGAFAGCSAVQLGFFQNRSKAIPKARDYFSSLTRASP